MMRKIQITVILLVLAPSILIAGVMYYYTKSAIVEEKYESLAGITQMMDFYISQRYNTLISDISKKTEMDILKRRLETQEADSDKGSYNETREKIKQLLSQNVSVPILEGALVNLKGEVILSNRPQEEGLILNKTNLYNSIMSGAESYMGLVIEPGSTEKVEIAVPVFDNNERITGIIKQIITLDNIKKYLGSIKVGETGYTFLIWNNGQMIFQDDIRRSIMLYPEYQNGSNLEKLIFDYRMDQLEEPEGTVSYSSNGAEFMGTYKLVGDEFCIAVAAIEKEEILSGLTQHKMKFLGFASLIILVTILIGFIISNSVHKPIQRIISNTRKLVNGDLTARCPAVKNEILQELCNNINNLADRVQKNERELRMSSRIDGMTHLPNRCMMYEVLDTLLYKHPNQALLLLELEGMEVINANLGHDIGDKVIMEVGDILRALPHNVCYSSRLGGNTFLVLVTNWTSFKYPERIAKKLIKKIEGIKFIGEIHVDVGVNIGIQYIDEEKIDKKKLIKQSHMAMSKAKMEGNKPFFVSYSSKQKEV